MEKIKVSDENTDGIGTTEVPEGIDEQEINIWVTQLSSYFSRGMLENFFAKEKIERIRIASIQGEKLADAVIAKLLEVIKPYRAGLPEFTIVKEESDRISSSKTYDIFVKKI